MNSALFRIWLKQKLLNAAKVVFFFKAIQNDDKSDREAQA